MLRTILLLPLALAPLAALADDCGHAAERTLDIDAAGVSTLQFDAAAGELDIRAVPGLARIEVRGRACHSEEEGLAEIQLRQERTGADVRVSAIIPDPGSRWGLFGGSHAYMDLRVRMPDGIRLVLRDSSGDLRVEGLRAGLDLTDSSGDIELHDIGGGIEVADSSGDIDARKIVGDFMVRSDSSGDIDIAGVEGSVRVRDDSSGDVDIRDVTGDAEVGRDSSGNITFDTIGGSAKVGSDGSGDIRASKVRGDFTVERKANADDIRHRDVGGRVNLPQAD
jgi:hypothetical protein